MSLQFDHYSIQPLDTSKPEDFYHLIATNRLRLEDFFAGTVAKTMTLEATKAYCHAIDARVATKQYIPFIIVDRHTNQWVGLLDVKNIDWESAIAELGYFIDVNYEGRGLTSKALGLLMNYLKETYPLKQLLCRVASENIASKQVALRNGFQFEKKVANDYTTTKGKTVDLDYYVLRL
ncbi:RimJ/RimL family protein N-acetyltransferase [Flavobacteriaceae bacterium MAR_2010_72]|nr:RimJ/RimL family protein N-acetyltransferase [Flavobacteriaceae bacterium MAR_2010_72]TVZ59245.1 RimJ/RimL family protein N-acetyltransferase [Flavobacteriaceae bacterium MAR_2010_105]